MSDGPKLFDHKPKKVLKQKVKDYYSPSTMASSQSATPPPPPPPKESFARRYKFVWPLLLAVNLAIGAYLFMRTKNKETDQESEVAAETPSPASKQASPALPENAVPVSPIVGPPPLKAREPIPEEDQRKLFHWMLEEKRKVKAANPEEKKRLDEEKATLKHFIRSKSISSF